MGLVVLIVLLVYCLVAAICFALHVSSRTFIIIMAVMALISIVNFVLFSGITHNLGASISARGRLKEEQREQKRKRRKEFLGKHPQCIGCKNTKKMDFEKDDFDFPKQCERCEKRDICRPLTVKDEAYIEELEKMDSLKKAYIIIVVIAAVLCCITQAIIPNLG